MDTPTPALLAHGGAADVRRHELEARAGSGDDRRGARHAADRRTPRRTRRSSGDAAADRGLVPHRERPRAAVAAPCPTSRSRPTCVADDLRWDAEGGSLLLERPSRCRPPRTRVNAQLVRPTPDALRGSRSPTDLPRTARYTQLPVRLPARRSRTSPRRGPPVPPPPTTRSSRSSSGSTVRGSEFSYDQDVEPRERLQRAARLPRGHQAGVLPAVRGVDGGDASFDRHPGPGRRGLHRREVRRRDRQHCG